MSKQRDFIDDDLADWLRRQHVFFVATAPESKDGYLNCFPKGGSCFRVLGPAEVAYQGYTGKGAETVAHPRENGRIVLMFCAFEGKLVSPPPAALPCRCWTFVRIGKPWISGRCLRENRV